MYVCMYILNDSDSPINSLSDDIYIICWGNLVFRKLLVGGHPAPPHPFILQNCVYSYSLPCYILFLHRKCVGYTDGPRTLFYRNSNEGSALNEHGLVYD